MPPLRNTGPHGIHGIIRDRLCLVLQDPKLGPFEHFWPQDANILSIDDSRLHLNAVAGPHSQQVACLLRKSRLSFAGEFDFRHMPEYRENADTMLIGA